jgi:hypothetical protein
MDDLRRAWSALAGFLCKGLILKGALNGNRQALRGAAISFRGNPFEQAAETCLVHFSPKVSWFAR